jgi:hypothetical protein
VHGNGARALGMLGGPVGQVGMVVAVRTVSLGRC